MRYRGLDSGTRVSDVNMVTRELHPFNNKELRVSQSKLDVSELELTGRKARWYARMSPLHTHASSVAKASSVLILHCISMKGRDMNIARIVSTIDLLRYHILPLPVYSDIFVGHKLNQVNLIFINFLK